MNDQMAVMLAAKRAQLKRQLTELTQPPEPGSIGFGKRIGDGTNQAVERITAVSAHGKLKAMLTEVERAENKLGEGTFGLCDVCESAIDPARLEARPWATRCVEHV